MIVTRGIPLRRLFTIIVICLAVVCVGVFVWMRLQPQVAGRAVAAPMRQHEAFPAIDSAGLSSTQQSIVTLLRQEYTAQNPGTYYSEGVSEPWCANFVSWIMHEAGHPLANPHSGSWRIPGTITLREYYQSVGKFRPPSYRPQLGDVVLYDEPGLFGQHTNIVIKNDNGILTTIGGNELGNIRIYTNREPERAGVVGYGIL